MKNDTTTAETYTTLSSHRYDSSVCTASVFIAKGVISGVLTRYRVGFVYKIDTGSIEVVDEENWGTIITDTAIIELCKAQAKLAHQDFLFPAPF